MFKISVICAFLCTVLIFNVQALKKAVFTEKLKFKTRYPFVVENGGHLYSLIVKNETHMETYSLDNDIEPCTYDLESSRFNDIRPAILQAVLFGSASTTVVGLGVRSYVTEDGYREAVYDLVWFDLKDCKYRIMKQVFVDNVPASYPEYQPQLIAYKKTFDLFLIGNRDCSPCRYNRLGMRVPLKDQLKHEPDRHFRSFHLRSVLPKTLDRFLYTYSFQNGTSIIKLLNPYYRVIRQRYVDDPVNAVAVNNDIGALFGLCYVALNYIPRQRVACERLDIYLNAVHSFDLPIPENNFVLNMTISLDSWGNSFIGVIQSSLNDRRHSKWLVFFHYDRYGQLRESLDFGDIGRRQSHNEPEVFTQLESYIIADQFCLVVYEELGYYYAHNHRLHIRCIRISTGKENKIFKKILKKLED